MLKINENSVIKIMKLTRIVIFGFLIVSQRLIIPLLEHVEITSFDIGLNIWRVHFNSFVHVSNGQVFLIQLCLSKSPIEQNRLIICLVAWVNAQALPILLNSLGDFTLGEKFLCFGFKSLEFANGLEEFLVLTVVWVLVKCFSHKLFTLISVSLVH